MKLVISWLEDFLEIPWVGKELAERLPDLGIGVEGAESDVLDLEIAPNRGDLLSTMGIARDVHAATGALLRLPEERLPQGRSAQAVAIAQPALVPRYSAAALSGVRVRQTKNKTITTRLMKSGMRPVNNIVDITNYIMLETGQPAHAFDQGKIHGRMEIRLSKRGETLTTLDGVERSLPDGVLVIEDRDGLIDLAGVMGGANSAIDQKTSSILLQAAVFDPPTIRRAARALKLVTEASYRYERSVDPGGTITALAKLVALVREEAGGELVSVTDIDRTEQRPAIIFEHTRTERLLGRSFPPSEVKEILTRLGCTVAERGSGYNVMPPTWRADLREAEDLVEEIARIKGYQTIPGQTLPRRDAKPSPDYKARESLKDWFVSQGLAEVATYSLISDADLVVSETLVKEAVSIANPLSKDLRYFRSSLLPGLLKALAKNVAVDQLRIFEIGRVATTKEEKVQVGVLFAGRGAEEIVEVVKPLGLESSRIPSASLNQYKIKKSDVFTALGDWTSVKAKVSLTKDLLLPGRFAVKPLSKYPVVSRDISFIVDEETRNDEVKTAISNVSEYVYLVEQFDEFTGPQIGAGKKSLAFHIHYQHKEKTMTTQEIDALHGKVADLLRQKFGATIR